MRRESLAFAPFLDALERRLDALTAAQLRQVLLDHAAGLPAAERGGFLALFEAGPAAPAPEGGSDQELVEDVTAFLDEVASGYYAEGDGFDPEYGEYRTFGDETWTIEFDGLLARAGRALLDDDPAVAREAYAGLLDALDGGYEGYFPGAGTPAELVSSDIREAKHRYLRAVWETEPLGTRAEAVVEAAEDVAFVGGDPSLAAIEATTRAPLPDLETVLGDLGVHLAAVAGTGWGFGRQAQQLLAEVTERYRGVDGLAELARSAGDGQPGAYRDWVDGLARAARMEEAEQAAVEALERMPAHGEVRATIAERLAVLATVHGDGQQVLEARRAAWRADPTLARLLSLVDVGTALSSRDEVLAAEADQPAEGPLTDRAELAAALLLLAHQVDDAIDLVRLADPFGWSSGIDRHPGPVVVPFLLLGAGDAASYDRFTDTLLFALLDEANDVGWAYGGPGSEELAAFRALVGMAEDRPGRFEAIHRDHMILSAQLIEALAAHPPGHAERRHWLDVACEVALERIDAVVGGQHRGAYRRVALLAVACAEAAALADGGEAGARFIAGCHTRHPRHTAFRRELRETAAQSPLL